MRFNAVATAVSAAFLAGNVYADDAQKVVKDESSSSTAPTPTFTVSFPSKQGFQRPFSPTFPLVSCFRKRTIDSSGSIVSLRSKDVYIFSPNSLIPTLFALCFANSLLISFFYFFTAYSPLL